jgi:uncharacterized protein YcbX
VIHRALGGLARWPVKSMAGERLRAARLDGRGVGGDRTHALLDARQGRRDRPLTAARAPRLLAWAAAYPGAPDDALDPATPPPASLRAPDGTVWGWQEAGLAAALGRPVDLRRFRTNLHLDLDAPAFAEERWQGARLRVGPVVLALLHPCPRCVVPTTDPDGRGRWPELLRHLHRARGGLFGVNARVLVPGRVALGDPATVAVP